jgi:hypothetical protein
MSNTENLFCESLIIVAIQGKECMHNHNAVSEGEREIYGCT